VINVQTSAGNYLGVYMNHQEDRFTCLDNYDIKTNYSTGLITDLTSE